jgi:uncharacterized protein YkwD
MKKSVRNALLGLLGTSFGLYVMAVPLAAPAYAQASTGHYSNSKSTNASNASQDPVEVVKAAARSLGFNATTDKFTLASKSSTAAVVSVVHNGTNYNVNLRASSSKGPWVITSVKTVTTSTKSPNANSGSGPKNPTGSGSATTGGSTTSGSTTTTATSASAAEQQAVSLLNADRSANGLSALQVDSRLTSLARNYAQDMIDRNYFSHYNPEGQSPFDRLKQAGISYSAAGENIGVNQSVAKAEAAFMNSSGHRANILNSAYTKVGIGVAYDKNGNIYIVQDFIKP